jgi:integrase
MSEIVKPTERVAVPIHTKPIVVQGSRVFTPMEYVWIRRYLPTEIHKMFLDGLLLTGMRGVEWAMFVEQDFTWFDQTRRKITIPPEAVKKVKVKIKQRDVILSDAGMVAINKLITVQDSRSDNNLLKMPLRSSWGTTLRRAAYKARIPEPDTIVPKSTRKTWESWLILTHPNNAIQITMSMGHDDTTAIRHYLGMGWSLNEFVEAREYTRGFIQERPDIFRSDGSAK